MHLRSAHEKVVLGIYDKNCSHINWDLILCFVPCLFEPKLVKMKLPFPTLEQAILH